MLLVFEPLEFVEPRLGSMVSGHHMYLTTSCWRSFPLFDYFKRCSYLHS